MADHPDDLDDPLVIAIGSLEDLDAEELLGAIRKARAARPGYAEAAELAGLGGIEIPVEALRPISKD